MAPTLDPINDSMVGMRWLRAGAQAQLICSRQSPKMLLEGQNDR
ncbi:hypothetical protein [Frigidibacter sp. MR17.24]